LASGCGDARQVGGQRQYMEFLHTVSTALKASTIEHP